MYESKVSKLFKEEDFDKIFGGLFDGTFSTNKMSSNPYNLTAIGGAEHRLDMLLPGYAPEEITVKHLAKDLTIVAVPPSKKAPDVVGFTLDKVVKKIEFAVDIEIKKVTLTNGILSVIISTAGSPPKEKIYKVV